MVEAICPGRELLSPRSQINYDVPVKPHETVKLRNQNPLLTAVNAEAQGCTLTVSCGTNPISLNASIARLSHVGGASAHGGQSHTIMLVDSGLYTEAYLPRWSRVALAQTDIDEIISQVAHLIQGTGNSSFLTIVTSD